MRRRHIIHVACRTLSFLISVFVLAHNFYSQSAFIISKNTFTSKTNNTNNERVSFNNNNIDEYMELTTPKAEWTLVHYDPYFMGGFRNQHMRFVALIAKSVEHNITQILLPSLRWGDVSQPGKSAPHELLFDVVHWNKRAGEFGLPRLVRYEANILEQNIGGGKEVIPCFNTTSSMYSGLNEKQWRSKDIKLRRYSIWDYLGEPSLYAHCKHSFDVIHSSNQKTLNGPMTYLVPHGGTKSAGRLWWEYNAMQGHRSKPDASSGKYADHLPLEQAIYKILIPSWPIRDAIQKSLDEAIGTSTIKPNVLALHPRIEHDMLTHIICSKYMQSNLTKIFESISNLPKFDLLFLAVSRALVDGEPPLRIKNEPNLLRVATENRILLNQTRSYGVWGTEQHKGIPILESGISTAAKIEFPVMEQSNHDGSEFVTANSLGVTEIVASLVNFFTALKADAFVGVRGSTFSQDVFSVRYYQHQDSGGGGENNFVVGPFGMQQLFGPAEPLPCK